MMSIPIFPLILAAGLTTHGLRRKSLSSSGAIAAFVIGFIMMSAQVRAFGVSLIIFYLVGSRATKAGKATKASLEEGHHEAGNRTAEQVLCNSFSAFIATIAWTALFIPGSFLGHILPKVLVDEGESYHLNQWCPLSASRGHGWSRFLLLITLGHFACCLGDTLASELGILSKTPPILITTLKRVPPGTNGGISTLGTVASVSGGLVMGLTMATSLAVESPACRVKLTPLLLELVFVGAVAGLFGSLVDSLMGATIQRTRYSNKTKRILLDEADLSSLSTEDIKIVSGLDLLTNNQVNLLSSIITAVATAYLAPSILD